ncbi:TRAP transporter small permease [Anaerobacillus sp. MEB173]|uniref:TRAP transporter small permease n=1 Tax=Anaerobacillus sp. MEB173 TaxID=3383345 RepID=UPI003F8DC749
MGKAIHYMNLSIKYLLNVILVTLIVAVFCQVLFRFVLNQPLAWTEELARYCLVWITFLGAAFAMSKKAHIGIEVFVNLLPSVLRKASIVLSTLVCIGFFYILIQQGFSLSERSMAQLSPVLRLPMGAVYSVIPISGIILSINLLHITWIELTKKEGV